MDAIVRRITIIRTGPQGPSAEVLYELESKRPKGSQLLKPVERLQRRVLEAQKVLTDEALALHKKHARKRKDGWLRDAPMIVFKANRRALKKLTGW